MTRTKLKAFVSGVIAILISVSLSVTGLAYTLNTVEGKLESKNYSKEEYNNLSPVEKLYALSGEFDPDYYARTYPEVVASVGKDPEALVRHYENIGAFEGKKANALDSKAPSLAVMRLITKYLAFNKQFYLNNLFNVNFKYFNAAEYLKKYPEVYQYILQQLSAAGKDATTENLYIEALDHYITKGALEGRSSCTSFDPVWAILDQPSCVSPDGQNITPDNIAQNYYVKTGKTITTDLEVGQFSVDNFLGETADVLTIKKKTEEVPASSGSSNNDSQPSSNTVAPIRFLNSNASVITPYQLYSLNGGSIFNNGTFDLDTYKEIYDQINGEVPQKYTLMMYICGTDLEENGKSVTSKIAEMILAGYDPRQMNVLVCVGGTTNYESEVLMENNNLGCSVYYINPVVADEIWNEINRAYEDYIEQYHLTTLSYFEKRQAILNRTYDDGSKLIDYIITDNEAVLLGRYGSTDMGQAELLCGFMNLATDLFPAENYALTLDDHGGGVLSGICFSSSNNTIKGTGLELHEIEEALACSNLYRNQNQKLAYLCFDACMMGSAEIAYNLYPYYQYMLGCSEIENGDYDYLSLLQTINSGISAQNEHPGDDSYIYDATKISLDLLENFKTSHAEKLTYIQSAAIFDSGMIVDNCMKDLNDIAQQINVLAECTIEYNASDIYNAVRKAGLKSYNIGYATTRYGDRDYVDILDFVNNLKTELTALKGKESETFDSLIDYVVSSIDAFKEKSFVKSATIYYQGKELLAFGHAYSTMAEAQTAIESASNTFGYDNWTKLYNNYMYAATIFVPLGGGGSYYSDENITKYIAGYGNDPIIADYIKLIKNLSDFEKAEVDDNGRITKLYSQLLYDQFKDVYIGFERPIDGSSNMIRYKFKENYSENIAPASTSGSVLMDIADILDAVSVAVVDKREASKITVNYDESSSDVFYPIISKTKSDLFCLSGSNNAIIIDENNVKNFRVYEVVGKTYDNNTIELKSYALPSDNEGCSDKDKIISVLGGTGSSNDYLTVQCSLLDSSDKILGVKYGDDPYTNYYMLFEVKDNNLGAYLGIAYPTSDGNYAKYDNTIKGVSPLHYGTSVNEYNNNAAVMYYQLEGSGDYSASYFSTVGLQMKTSTNNTTGATADIDIAFDGSTLFKGPEVTFNSEPVQSSTGTGSARTEDSALPEENSAEDAALPDENSAEDAALPDENSAVSEGEGTQESTATDTAESSQEDTSENASEDICEQ